MNKKRFMENAIHGIFLILGLITVGCVLLITVYLVISGIPAIRKIGVLNFLFGKKWASTAAQPQYGIFPFILTSIYGTACLCRCGFGGQPLRDECGTGALFWLYETGRAGIFCATKADDAWRNGCRVGLRGGFCRDLRMPHAFGVAV